MKKIIVINSEIMGKGNDELGRKIMASFLRKLTLQESYPEAIIFYNTGVKLVAVGTPILAELKSLEERGIDLIACGTCVSFFELQDKILVGRVSDMQEIVTHLTKADKVVTI